MSVGILIITHGDLGKDLINTAESMLGTIPLPIEEIPVHPAAHPDAVIRQARQAIKRIDQGDGVLILTDIFGSTPSNIACRLSDIPHTNIIAGLNLPMLIRVLNYSQMNLENLTQKALSGGQEGVLNCLLRLTSARSTG